MKWSKDDASSCGEKADKRCVTRGRHGDNDLVVELDFEAEVSVAEWSVGLRSSRLDFRSSCIRVGRCRSELHADVVVVGFLYSAVSVENRGWWWCYAIMGL
ncbi:hypothetical protein F0562_022581 [Nyssa sinensis]|uniref:Uncharacterized protein n=1 Tax=Nyssa sinensis TaxID=561372 RepID=A0A5J5BR35_9ASTE|nr:hypothetical protein F0562_022581 [Nyssa sinensis]